MKTVFIRINSIDKVKNFVNCTTNSELELDLVSGRFVIDAKSIMGIFSLDLSRDIELCIHSENEETINKFLETIKDFIVKK